MSRTREDGRFRLLMGFQKLSDGVPDRTLRIVGGKGIFVHDETGKEYLEASSSFYCATLGYSDDELIEAALGQLRTLPVYLSAQGRATLPALELAERLAELVPLADARVHLAATGSEAIDHLVKFLRFRNWASGQEQRTKLIARVGSYHGSTLASASLTGMLERHAEFGLPLEGIFHVAQPDFVSLAEPGERPEGFAARMVEEVERLILREGPETFAAFITEPVSFSAGFVLPPPGYFEKLQAVLARYGILYLDDEVVTGFGRLGHWFGTEVFDLRPECMVFSKGLSSGYMPIAALAMTGDFYDALDRGSERAGVFNHAATFAGHPVAAAVALRTLRILEERKIPERVRDITGPALARKIQRYADHPLVVDARSLGLAGAVEFVGDAGAPALAPSSTCRTFCERCQANGLFVRGTGRAAVLAPPLVITTEEIDELFRRFDRALEETLDPTRIRASR